MNSNTNEEIRLIDIELSEHERRGFELKARRNACVPIARLPNEILLEIFVFARVDLFFRRWHYVAHVCRHWRRVALGAADLWTTLPIFSHDYTLVMLERSRNRLLDIFIDKKTSRSTRDAVLKHLVRIRSLNLTQDTEGLEYFQDQLIDTTLQMRILKIFHFPTSVSGTSLPSPPPLRLTSRQTASLQSLDLSFMDLDWQIFPIRSLKSLHFHHMWLSNPPSWAEVQKALDGMPLLENFRVSLTDFRLDLPGSPLPQPLNMPRLRKLSIIDSTDLAVTYFLSNTTFPQLMQLHVTIDDMDDYQDTIHAMATTMDISLSNSLFLTTGNSVLTMPSEPGSDGRGLSFWPCTSEEDVIEEDLTLDVRLARHVMAELAIHPTSRIVNLTLQISLTSDESLEIFGYSLPHLESIEILSCRKQVLNSLTVPSSHPFGRPIPFASVQTMKLLAMYAYDRDSDDVYPSALREALCECLRTRLKHGSPIAKLVLDCELTPEQVDELKELVGDLEFGDHL